MPVRLLDDALIDQIAAGEVVERPASVVKELVENSVDAGATQVRVHLKDGGKSLIRITDNGCGMDRQDAVMCLERHATSKIRTLQDLMEVSSLGFRGEALPSIASVSRMEMLTRRPEDEVGTRVSVEGGVLQGVADAGCAVGTQITVRSLFYNVPVRRAFMRTPATELGHCVDAVLRQILVRPELDAVVLHGDREVLRAPMAPDLSSRVRSVMGRAAEALRPVRFEREGIAVDGLISPVGTHHASARGVHLYIGGRYVRDPVLRRALRLAYEGIVPRGRHPMVVLRISLPSESVDVNVHPNKTEVRFKSPRQVVDVLAAGLRETLVRTRPRTSPDPVSNEAPSLPLPLSAHPDDDPSIGQVSAEPQVPAWLAAEVGVSQPPQSPSLPSPPSPPAATAPTTSPADAPVDGEAVEFRALDLLPGGVLLARERDLLWVVDTRAVRQQSSFKVLLGGGSPQRLLVPRTVEPGQAFAARLIQWAEALETHGLSISDFGPGTVVLKRIPECLLEADWGQLAKTVASALPATAVGALPPAALQALVAGDRRPYGSAPEALDALLSLPRPWLPTVARRLSADEVRSWIR